MENRTQITAEEIATKALDQDLGRIRPQKVAQADHILRNHLVDNTLEIGRLYRAGHQLPLVKSLLNEEKNSQPETVRVNSQANLPRQLSSN
jgi:hypothetical protein